MRYWTVEEARAYLPRLRLLVGVIRRATRLAASATGNGHATLPGSSPGGRTAGDAVDPSDEVPVAGFDADQALAGARAPRDRAAGPRAGPDRFPHRARRPRGVPVLAARRGRSRMVAPARGRIRGPAPPPPATGALIEGRGRSVGRGGARPRSSCTVASAVQGSAAPTRPTQRPQPPPDAAHHAPATPTSP